MISIITQPATQWLASVCRDSVRLVDGPAKLRRHDSARSQELPMYARAHMGVAAAPSALADVAAALALPASVVAGAEVVPTQPFAKRGVGPQPWRDAPVIT